MSRRTLVVLGLLAAGIGVGAPARGQEGARPTKEHKILEAEAGTWDVTVKAYFAGPDADPIASEGTSENTMLGGLWLVSDFRGEVAGTPFRGHGVYGYDPSKKKYVASWVDSMTSTISLLEGTYDPASKTLTMHGEGTDPSSGAKMKERHVTHYKDDDTHVFTLYLTQAGGEEMKAMEITSKRRKKP